MKWLWKPFSKLQEALEEDVGEGDVRTPRSTSTLRPLQINDHVYEIHKPAGRPSVELIFFHGLQLEPGSSEEAHINTWVSQDKGEYWWSWLLEDLPEARILTISYDAAARTSKTEGRMDMYVTSENLVYSLTGDSARVGQDGCPVVLVGHCLGGLVMKELCCQAYHMIRLPNHSKPVENFLANVKGLFFYATPHHGSLLAESNRHSLTGPLIKALRSLEVDTARRNEDFRQLRMAQGWKTFGIVGLLPVKLKLFEGIVVPEASARSDMDDFYAAAVDHYNICRPINKQSSTYHLLLDFARPFVREWQRIQEEEKGILDFRRGFEEDYSVRRAIWVSELSSLQRWKLRVVELLLVLVHLLMMGVISGLGAYSLFQSFIPTNHEISSVVNNDKNPDEGSFDIARDHLGKMGSRISKGIVLQALNFLSAIVNPLACVYLLRFYMTRRWAHPLELVSELLNRPVLVNLWLTQPSTTQDVESSLELGSRQDDDSKLEVGYTQKEDSILGVGSRRQEHLQFEVEPLLPGQQLESQVEAEPVLLPPMQSQTKIDVDPLLVVPFKQTRRLRSRGPNTNKVGPQS